MKKFILTILFSILLPAMVWGAGAFIPAPKFAVEDSNGAPLSGGLVYTYECGTTTPKATYSDRALGSANANPVVLDSRGEANVYQTGCLKIVLKTSAGVTIYTVDNFSGVGESFLQDADGDTIINVEESTDEDIIRVDIAGTEQLTIQDGSVTPTTTNDIDLGSNDLRFKNIHTNRISGHPFPGFVVRPKFTYVESLDYDGGTGAFAVGETVTGAGGGTGVVVGLSTSSATASGTLYINTRNATAYVNDEVLTGSVAGVAVANGASSKNAIAISPFVYYHSGTTEQLLYCDTTLFYEFTSLGTSDWSYLYFDDSAIVTAGTNLISISQLTDNVDEPAYSAAKHGRYHQTTVTNDMCFMAVLTDGSDNILEFFHDGGDFVYHADHIVELTDSECDTTWVDVDCATSSPKFSTKIQAFITTLYGGGQAWVKWRVNGQSGLTGHRIHCANLVSHIASTTLPVMTDANQVFEVVHESDTTSITSVNINGWYFPNGM